MKSDGSNSELVVNDIGRYSGEHLINVGGSVFGPSPGFYALAVDADGPWTVEIR